jgi:hypothetical protein
MGEIKSGMKENLFKLIDEYRKVAPRVQPGIKNITAHDFIVLIVLKTFGDEVLTKNRKFWEVVLPMAIAYGHVMAQRFLILVWKIAE